MAEFSLNDMEQAKRRVYDMQQRTRNLTGVHNNSAARQNEHRQKESASFCPPDKKEEPLRKDTSCEKAAEKQECTQSLLSGTGGLSGLFGGNSDRTLILLLLALLWGEKSDNLLLLALLYCAM